MKKLIITLILFTLLGFAGISFADPEPVSGEVEIQVTTEAPAAAPDATPVTVDKGDTAWMMVSTLLVLMMVVPGLGLFYGGLVRSKNMLSVLMQVMMVFSLIIVLWAIYGYSLAFGGSGLVIGNLDKVFLSGVTTDSS